MLPSAAYSPERHQLGASLRVSFGKSMSPAEDSKEQQAIIWSITRSLIRRRFLSNSTDFSVQISKKQHKDKGKSAE